MIELFLITMGFFFFCSICLALVMYAVVAVFYILKFTLPLLLRLILFVFFSLSVIKPDNRKSFDGTYAVRYLKWNDEDGKVYCTDDIDVKIRKMYYAFKGDTVYSDFDLDWNGYDALDESHIGKIFGNVDCFTEVNGWFTINARGTTRYSGGQMLMFEIRMRKISNKVIKKYFRCMNV